MTTNTKPSSFDNWPLDENGKPMYLTDAEQAELAIALAPGESVEMRVLELSRETRDLWAAITILEERINADAQVQS